jgi:catechol 2,3-dioxygenase-like lactoylglutathione lyase family enzyme
MQEILEQRITIISLGVENLKTSTKFYTDCFGWQKTADSNEDIVFIKLNGFILSLYNREKLAEDATVDPKGSGFRGVTLAYNCISEAEVDEIIEMLRNKDVHIVKKPQKVFWGGYSSYIADPDGHLWEIAYNPFLQMDSEGNVE